MLSDTLKPHLGRYELLAKLASGGMGEVFLARLEGAAGFEKLYAVKRILPHLAGDLRFRGMLIDEARIASKLSHPNVCQVYELGETGGELYIAMEYLEGVTLLPILRHAVTHGRLLELGLVGAVIQQIAEGLHYAHELRDRDGTPLNIVHRDVTPSNIYVTESGVAKVLDFGIAKARTISSTTQTGTIKGKHAYMAPEQLRGAALDRRVDVFAVGVLLFEMLALRRLFQRRTEYLTLQAVMDEPIPDVRLFRGDLPEPLVAVLGRALQRDRDQRFETVRQLSSAVTDAISEVERVWTPAQLSEQIAERFGQELGHRNAAVLAAVARPADGDGNIPSLEDLEVHGRNTAVSDPGLPGQEEEELDDDLPAITSDLHARPTRLERTPVGPVAALPVVMMGRSTAQHASMPPPASGATGQLPAMQAMPAMPGTPGGHAMPGFPGATGQMPTIHYPPGHGSHGGLQPVVSDPVRRTWPWAVFAAALLGIATAALVIVWRNSQQQQQQVVLYQETSHPRPQGGAGGATANGRGSEPAEPAEPTAPVDGANLDGSGDSAVTGSGKPDKPDGKRPVRDRRDPKKVLQDRVNSLRPSIVRCLGQNNAQTQSIDGSAVLEIAASGKVSSVVIRPASLSASLSSCIKAVFIAERFPEQQEKLEITVPFATKMRPPL